jgi:hypothetical protein
MMHSVVADDLNCQSRSRFYNVFIQYSVTVSVMIINHSCLSLIVCMVLFEHLGIDC